MEVPVFSFIGGDKISIYELNKEIFDIKYRPRVVKIVIDWQLAKRRSGNHSTKTISQISGTTAKPHRQKGTGRARQGSLRSPQFRGGAVIFGPLTRDHGYSLNKKVKKLSLKIALSYKMRSNKIIFVDSISNSPSKTSEFKSIINKMCSGSVLIVSDKITNEIKMSSSNINNVNIIPIVGLNTYDVMRHGYIIVSVDSIKSLEDRLL